MDWVNDELPYDFKTSQGPIKSFPLNPEIEDYFTLLHNLHSESSWVQQVLDAANYLREEAEEQGGRLLTLNIHPWIVGQPHRIRYLREIITSLSKNEETFFVSAAEVLKVLEL